MEPFVSRKSNGFESYTESGCRNVGAAPVGRISVHMLLTLSVLSVGLICSLPLRAQTLTVLYNFTGQADGGDPLGDLIMDAQENLYGTTIFGGNLSGCLGSGCGVVYKLTQGGEESVLHTFSTGPWGVKPITGVIMDTRGDLYGTALGGKYGWGLVYEMSPGGDRFHVLHFFTGGTDGAGPEGPLVRDGKGNIYGTTASGGDSSLSGVVFELSRNGTETVVHTFTYPSDGRSPQAGVIRDRNGILYGTTTYGGNDALCSGMGCGSVFKVTPGGKETILHSFVGGVDGVNPSAVLIRDSQGNLYGTTVLGGSSGLASNLGTVFKVTPDGTETVLHSFDGTDGAYPSSRLLLDSQGNLYGTTRMGGTENSGTIFKIASDGAETVLYSFSGISSPGGGLILDGQGNLYGTAQRGGTFDQGVVFKLAP